jgi:hypothetical protein
MKYSYCILIGIVIALSTEVYAQELYYYDSPYILKSDYQFSYTDTIATNYSVLGLMVDHVSDKLFYSELSHDQNSQQWVNSLHSINKDGTNITLIRDSIMSSPNYPTAMSQGSGIREIILNPNDNKLYFEIEDYELANNSLNNSGVLRINLDGTNLEIVNDNIEGGPTPISLDPVANKIYFTDDELYRMDTDGSNVETLVGNAVISFILELETQSIYYQDFFANEIRICDLDGSNNQLLHSVSDYFIFRIFDFQLNQLISLNASTGDYNFFNLSNGTQSLALSNGNLSLTSNSTRSYVLSLGCTDIQAHNYDDQANFNDSSCETCSDGILNGDETQVDCGGILCNACPPCTNVILDCAGANDQIHISPYSSPSQFTIMAWFKSFSNPNGSNEDRIISFSSPRLEIGLDKGTNEGKLWVYDPSGGGVMSWGTDLHDDNWHHVVLTRNGANRSIYLDGNFIDSWTGNANGVFGSYCRIGTWSGSTSDADWFGQLDDIRIYDTAYSLSDIQTFMNCKPDGTEPNLVSLWDFEDGTAAGDNTSVTTVLDRTGNGADGTLFNFILTGTSSNFVCADSTFVSGTCTCEVIANCTSPLIVEINNDGIYDILESEINSGSTTECGMPILDISPDTLFCSDVGILTVQLDVTDTDGNYASCITNVEVIDPFGNCCPSTLDVYEYGVIIPDGIYSADLNVTSSDLVPTFADVEFNSTFSICLESGFEVQSNAQFLAEIDGCCNFAQIDDCNKVIATIQPNLTAQVNVSSTNAMVDFMGCNASSFSLSWSNVINNDTIKTATCADLGISTYTVYLWNSNTLVDSCSNIFQILDGGGFCS